MELEVTTQRRIWPAWGMDGAGGREGIFRSDSLPTSVVVVTRCNRVPCCDTYIHQNALRWSACQVVNLLTVPKPRQDGRGSCGWVHVWRQDPAQPRCPRRGDEPAPSTHSPPPDRLRRTTTWAMTRDLAGGSSAFGPPMPPNCNWPH